MGNVIDGSRGLFDSNQVGGFTRNAYRNYNTYLTQQPDELMNVTFKYAPKSRPDFTSLAALSNEGFFQYDIDGSKALEAFELLPTTGENRKLADHIVKYTDTDDSDSISPGEDMAYSIFSDAPVALLNAAGTEAARNGQLSQQEQTLWDQLSPQLEKVDSNFDGQMTPEEQLIALVALLALPLLTQLILKELNNQLNLDQQYETYQNQLPEITPQQAQQQQGTQGAGGSPTGSQAGQASGVGNQANPQQAMTLTELTALIDEISRILSQQSQAQQGQAQPQAAQVRVGDQQVTAPQQQAVQGNVTGNQAINNQTAQTQPVDHQTALRQLLYPTNQQQQQPVGNIQGNNAFAQQAQTQQSQANQQVVQPAQTTTNGTAGNQQAIGANTQQAQGQQQVANTNQQGQMQQPATQQTTAQGYVGQGDPGQQTQRPNGPVRSTLIVSHEQNTANGNSALPRINTQTNIASST